MNADTPEPLVEKVAAWIEAYEAVERAEFHDGNVPDLITDALAGELEAIATLEAQTVEGLLAKLKAFIIWSEPDSAEESFLEVQLLRSLQRDLHIAGRA
jgi:hypothetical protein